MADEQTAPPHPAHPLRARLREALPAAMRDRDRATVAVLRATLAAIDNAEAVAASPAAAGAGAMTESPAGAGATDVPRRELGEAQVEALVRGEVAELRRAARDYETAGQHGQAARLRAQAAVLTAHLAG